MSFFKKTTFISLGWLALYPILAWAQNSTKLENPLAFDKGSLNPNEIFARVAGGLNFVTGALTLIIVVIGGYRILTAAGNEENYTKGKQMIVYAILGMLLTLGSYAILSTTVKTLTGNVQVCISGDKQGMICDEKQSKSICGKEGLCGSPLRQGSLIDPLGLSNLSTETSLIKAFHGKRVLGTLMGLLGAVALLMCVYGGFLWMTAAGNEERIGKARSTLLYAGLGIAIILGSYTFINFIYTPAYNLLFDNKNYFKVTKYCVNPNDANKNTIGCEKDNDCDEGGTCQPYKIATITEKKYACFRQKIRLDTKGNDISFGGLCAEETPSDCFKPKGGYKKGEILYKFENCSKVGYCVQTIPGKRWENRVDQNKCKVELFGRVAPMVKVNGDWTCAAGQGVGLIALRQLSNDDCYADVEFKDGLDFPGNGETATDNEWACKKPELSNGTLYDNMDYMACKAINGHLFTGVEYDEIGACVQTDNNRLFKLCINDVVKGKCTMLSFPAVGRSIPPFGCEGAVNILGIGSATQSEIDGHCYVEEVEWKVGKTCDQITGTRQQMRR